MRDDTSGEIRAVATPRENRLRSLTRWLLLALVGLVVALFVVGSLLPARFQSRVEHESIHDASALWAARGDGARDYLRRAEAGVSGR